MPSPIVHEVMLKATTDAAKACMHTLRKHDRISPSDPSSLGNFQFMIEASNCRVVFCFSKSQYCAWTASHQEHFSTSLHACRIPLSWQLVVSMPDADQNIL